MVYVGVYLGYSPKGTQLFPLICGKNIFSSFDKSMFSLEVITARTVMINDELVVPDDIANISNIMSEYE